MSSTETSIIPEAVTALVTKARALVASPKGGRPTLLTEAVHTEIVSRVRVGAFRWVAACASGIPYSTFQKWMTRGQREWDAYEEEATRWTAAHLVDEPEPMPTVHAALWYDVERASAQARVGAESAVMKDNPLAWLLKGPGRHQPGGKDGWADKLELGGSVGLHRDEAPMDLSKLSPEQLDQLEAIHASLAEATAASSALALPHSSGEG